VSGRSFECTRLWAALRLPTALPIPRGAGRVYDPDAHAVDEALPKAPRPPRAAVSAGTPSGTRLRDLELPAERKCYALTHMGRDVLMVPGVRHCVRAAFEAHGPLTRDDLVAALPDIPEGSVLRILSKMLASGQVCVLARAGE
jgi:hypothetical protein